MTRVIMDIKNEKKGKYLLDFLRQIDFLEIKENIPLSDDKQDQVEDKKNIEEILLNAPVLTEEEIQSIENVGKEFKNFQEKE